MSTPAGPRGGGRRRYTDVPVFDRALDRLLPLYEDGHTVVVSFSAGKDSGVCLELCLIAAKLTNRLPVHVIMRDEEIMFPGTYEYAERVAARTNEIDFRWVYACQPIINVFNRANPYFWVFDPELRPEQWVRQPPAFAERIPELNIEALVTPKRFPVAPGKDLIDVVGLRTDESRKRMLGLISSGGYLTGKSKTGKGMYRKCRPIYDWTDGDVWRAVQQNGWDYNRAYDVMNRLGVPRKQLRIAPPTMTPMGIDALKFANKAWPRWFDKVCERLPGVRSAAHFGLRAVLPERRHGETWKETFERECIGPKAPAWAADRAREAMNGILARHAGHATTELPERRGCLACAILGSWKALCQAMYSGDPFSLKSPLPYVEPEFFRAGAGTWGGRPQW